MLHYSLSGWGQPVRQTTLNTSQNEGIKHLEMQLWWDFMTHELRY